jgi:hypothetical protein
MMGRGKDVLVGSAGEIGRHFREHGLHRSANGEIAEGIFVRRRPELVTA